jgi:hypothetical protein
MKNRDVVVNHLSEVDFSGMSMPFIAVYDHPIDYPEHVTARVYDGDKPTNVVMLKDSEEEIAGEIRKETCFVRFDRGREDDPKLICAWG